jgi:hypothetical protein
MKKSIFPCAVSLLPSLLLYGVIATAQTVTPMANRPK